jgi:hypothetical protein
MAGLKDAERSRPMADDLFDTVIKALLGEDEAPPADRLGAAKAHVNSWVTVNAGQPPRWFCSRADFATRLGEIVAAPNRLTQGSWDFCIPAAVLNCWLRRFPELVAQFATSVYDTGGGALGDIETSAPEALKSFHLPTYAAGTMKDKPLPAKRRGRPATYRAADWILLAALHNYWSSDFVGSLDSRGATGPTSADAVEEWFDDIGRLYEDVDEHDVDRAEPAEQVRNRMSGAGTDVVLVGDMFFLSKGLFGSSITMPHTQGHAVALASAPEVVGGGKLRLRWFSWGDGINDADPDFLAVSTNAVFEHEATVAELSEHLSGYVTARARPNK